MKKIIGMIHLAGFNKERRMLDELEIYDTEGLYGAIIENYHGSYNDLYRCVHILKRYKTDLKLGVNVLPNDYEAAFHLADNNGLDFIQLDAIAGNYVGQDFSAFKYERARKSHPHIKVYGGVWPKYYRPVEGSSLESDLHDAMHRCDSIVVTGEKTGVETPMSKITRFRSIIGDKELIVGAGVNFANVEEQLSVADGAIIGSCFKHGGTRDSVDSYLVSHMMELARMSR